MPGPITQLLAEDHARLDGLLAKAVARAGGVDLAVYGTFREGLLRHIDHGAIAALLVPTPTPEIAGEIRKILGPHNEVEEGEAGVYAVCDDLLAGEAEAILERMRAYPPVKVARYQDGPRVCRTAEEALRVSALQFERHRDRR